MAGREEQKRRSAAIRQAAGTARARLARDVYELCKTGNLALVRAYLETELGMTRPFAEIRKELRREVNHETTS